MSIISVQAAIAAPSAPRADFPNIVPSAPFPDWDPTRDRDVADRLAWTNDDHDNDPLDGYPGPGRQDEPGDDFEPSPDDLAAYHAGDHDAQPGPLDDFELAIPEAAYWDYEFAAWAEREEFERNWHNAEACRMARGSLVGSHHE